MVGTENHTLKCLLVVEEDSASTCNLSLYGKAGKLRKMQLARGGTMSAFLPGYARTPEEQASTFMENYFSSPNSVGEKVY